MPSAFIEYPCQAPTRADTTAISWHPTLFQLAVGCTSGAVNVFLEEGEKHEATIKRDVAPVALAWHPNSKILMIGWEDGNITMWNEPERKLKEPGRVHEGKMVLLRWNDVGDRIVTGDEKGNIAVWSADKVNLTLLCKYQKDGLPQTQCIFRTRIRSKEKNFFFFGGDKGNVYYADESNNIKPAFSLGDFSPILAMYYWAERDAIIVITKTSYLYRFGFAADGKMEQQRKIKLSTSADGATADPNLRADWIGEGMIATVSSEAAFKIWDVERENNQYAIALPSSEDKPCAISYSVSKQILSVCTRERKIYNFSFLPVEGPTAWQAMPQPIELSVGSTEIAWAKSDHTVLAVNTIENVMMWAENVMGNKFYNQLGAFQLNSEKLILEKFKSGGSFELHANISIRGFDLHTEFVTIWSGKKVEIYEIKDANNFHHFSSFRSPASCAAIYTESIALGLPGRIELCNFQGVCKQTLVLGENEGEPTQLNIFGNFLAVLTSKNVVKCWDLGRREARPVGSGRKFEEQGPQSVGKITMIRVNPKGTHVAMLAQVAPKGFSARKPSTLVYVYEVERDAVATYSFGENIPIGVCWDLIDSRLLGIEVRSNQKGQPNQIYTVFVTPESDEIISQDSFNLPEKCASFVGMQVPYLFFMSESQDAPAHMEYKVMRDFLGMENVDEATRDAMLNFSYYMSVGNMDEAYRSVKLIKNPNVWENMAAMCVKTKRLDVAEVCLANMGSARGTKLLRESKVEPEMDAQLAMVAIELGMLEEAEKLYISANRHDLLNKLYQAKNDWKNSLLIAQKNDRIHLRTTFHLYGKYLEATGDTANAVKQYEIAETHRFEVPRMLWQAKNLEDLEAYVDNVKDKSLLEWWARYMESKGQFDKAVQYYQSAEDYNSLVRVFLFQNKIEEARRIALESGDTAAAYHFGHYYEHQDNIKEAIQFYQRAHCFNHGMRLAMDQNMDVEVLSLALQSSGKRMAEAAKYFEDKDMIDKAVLLYHKSGSLAKAVELCFQAELFESLGQITDDLPPDSDPTLINKCVDFFMSHHQYDKAVTLNIIGGNVVKALEIGLKHDVILTENMCEKMLQVKMDDPNKRISLLKEIAKVCKRQGSYHLATKMYTQAKDKTKAMKVLLKSGDTEKIIFFASMLIINDFINSQDVSRQPDLYVLAANYLQSQNWRHNPEIMKNIINFYTKAQAMDSLAMFYMACAQVEIDEYKNYDKALGAYKEAVKYMGKSKAATKEAKTNQMKKRITAIEGFLNLKALFATNPDAALTQCMNLIDRNEVEEPIRVGDMYSLPIEFYHQQKKWEDAFHLIEKMKQRKINLGFYIDRPILLDIYKANKVAYDESEEESFIDEEARANM